MPYRSNCKVHKGVGAGKLCLGWGEWGADKDGHSLANMEFKSKL